MTAPQTADKALICCEANQGFVFVCAQENDSQLAAYGSRSDAEKPGCFFLLHAFIDHNPYHLDADGLCGDTGKFTSVLFCHAAAIPLAQFIVKIFALGNNNKKAQNSKKQLSLLKLMNPNINCICKGQNMPGSFVDKSYDILQRAGHA